MSEYLAALDRPLLILHSPQDEIIDIGHAERLFRDHHRYRRRDLRGLAKRAPIWVTTEKDAVKLLPFWAGGVDLRVLRIGIEVSEPDQLLSAIDDLLR